MIFDIFLVLILIICLITDIKYQKIYNKIIFPSLITSLLLHYMFYNFNGLKFSLIGFITGFGILLIPYLLNGMGAGDVKLLAFIGSLKGFNFVVNTALYMSLIGAVIALIIVLTHKDFLNFMKNLILWIFSLFLGLKTRPKLPTSIFSKKFPYAIAIVGGATICLIFKEVWLI